MQAKDNRKQSHNLSAEQVKDLQYDQINGQEEKILANRDSSVEIQAAAKHMVHARIEALNFDPLTGQKLSTPMIQVFYTNDFDRMEQEGAFKGQTVEVVHDPRSANEMKVSKIDAAANSDLQNQTADKPLDEMTKPELLIKYADLYKEEAPKSSTIQSLRDAIEDKLIEIRGKEIAPNLNKANEAGEGNLKDGVRTGVPVPNDADTKEDKTSKGK